MIRWPTANSSARARCIAARAAHRSEVGRGGEEPLGEPIRMMPLFLYGTLLDPSLLAAKSGDAALIRRAVPALLPGYRRVLLRGTPYPTLLPDPRARVEGLLLPRIDSRALGRLAAYEGPPYRLAPVRVLTPRGPRRAWAWLTPRWRADAACAWNPPPSRPPRGRARP